MEDDVYKREEWIRYPDCEKDPRFWEQLKRHEGENRDRLGRHLVYKCPAGKLTVGWGHNLDDNPIPLSWFNDGLPPHEGQAITDECAKDLLKADVAECAKQLDTWRAHWRYMDTPRQAVLLNMCFNMGIGTLRAFEKLNRALLREDFEGAAEQMKKSRWYKQVGNRSKELVAQMLRNEWMSGDPAEWGE